MRVADALLIVLGILAGSLAGNCSAEDLIDTDGPDFVDSTQSVGDGRFTFEAGPYRQTQRIANGSSRATSTPVLLRYGVSRDWELRLSSDGAVWQTGSAGAASASRRGVADTVIGFKWHARDTADGDLAPAVSVIAEVELPTGSPNLRKPGMQPLVRSVIGWDLPAGFGFGMMPGLKYDNTPNDGHRYLAPSLGLTFGRWWTERFRTFVEASYLQIASVKNGGVIGYKDVGAAWIIGRDVEIGGRAGWHFNANTPDKYWLLLLAMRY